MSWLERIFRRRQLYDELGEEVREHLEEKTEQLMRLGWFTFEAKAGSLSDS